MTKITFVEHDGTRHEVDGDVGNSLMRAATDNGVPGIDADCGGLCACATCHVFIEREWASKITPRDEEEEEMLGIAEDVTDLSRLSCQIELDESHDGLVVQLPQAQH